MTNSVEPQSPQTGGVFASSNIQQKVLQSSDLCPSHPILAYHMQYIGIILTTILFGLLSASLIAFLLSQAIGAFCGVVIILTLMAISIAAMAWGFKKTNDVNNFIYKIVSPQDNQQTWNEVRNIAYKAFRSLKTTKMGNPPNSNINLTMNAQEIHTE